MIRNIYILALHSEGKIHPVTWEALSCARIIREKTGGDISLLLPGNAVAALAKAAAEISGADVIALEHESLEQYTAEGYLEAVAGEADAGAPSLFIIPHTPDGFDFAPRLAVRLKGACITGVEAFSASGEHLLFIRMAGHGKLKMDVAAGPGLAVITLLPGSFRAETNAPPVPGSVTVREISLSLKKTKWIMTKTSEEDTVNLGEAEVIVAAGRGIEKKENLELLQGVARLFAKSAIAGSRAVCDLGWLDYKRQVGVTGKTVSPKLYIACGISGAVQHVSGMAGSGTIVAINRDPNAAIFGIADVCIVEDLKSFLPAFLEAAGQKRK